MRRSKRKHFHLVFFCQKLTMEVLNEKRLKVFSEKKALCLRKRSLLIVLFRSIMFPMKRTWNSMFFIRYLLNLEICTLRHYWMKRIWLVWRQMTLSVNTYAHFSSFPPRQISMRGWKPKRIFENFAWTMPPKYSHYVANFRIF